MAKTVRSTLARNKGKTVTVTDDTGTARTGTLVYDAKAGTVKVLTGRKGRPAIRTVDEIATVEVSA